MLLLYHVLRRVIIWIGINKLVKLNFVPYGRWQIHRPKSTRPRSLQRNQADKCPNLQERPRSSRPRSPQRNQADKCPNLQERPRSTGPRGPQTNAHDQLCTIWPMPRPTSMADKWPGWGVTRPTSAWSYKNVRQASGRQVPEHTWVTNKCQANR